MRYVAALDYDHLDNGVFLSTLAQSLSQQLNSNNRIKSIIIHGESAYTERIMQTGVIREEASIRSVKDLNHRLVALFADQGVSTVGINPNRRNLITKHGSRLQIDHSFLNELPHQSVLLLSTLVHDMQTNQPVVLKLSRLTELLQRELNADQCFIFSKSDQSEVFTKADQPDALSWNTMEDSFRKEQIPDDLTDLTCSVRICTARDFNQIPDLTPTILVDKEAS